MCVCVRGGVCRGDVCVSVWSVVFGMWCGVWCGVWYVVCGVWCVIRHTSTVYGQCITRRASQGVHHKAGITRRASQGCCLTNSPTLR